MRSPEDVQDVPAIVRAEVALKRAARLKENWSGTLTRQEARALINELARLRRAVNEGRS